MGLVKAGYSKTIDSFSKRSRLVNCLAELWQDNGRGL